MKDLGEASYILGMKIYRDASKKILGSSQSTFLDMMLKWFSMKNFKDYLLIGQEITLSQKNYLTTPQKKEYMSRIPYT